MIFRAWQTIRMKYQDLFSSEKKKQLKLSSALVVIGALRINSGVVLFSSGLNGGILL